MTPNPLYQALVRALETKLPPRVVSRLLRDGMAPLGATPADLAHDVARDVLRGPVFRHLQTMGRSPDAARAIVGQLEEELARAAAASAPAAAPAATQDGAPDEGAEGGAHAAHPEQERAVGELRDALRPFNMYFSWAEVRKLRSLVQLAEDDLAQGRDPTALLDEATDQLQVVRHKLEDQLVLQARNLGDLEAALAAVEPLGTPAVRRLDSLIATVREAQDRRTLAEAEVERAEKLARELRKLVESTVLDETRALPDLGRGDGRPRAPTRAVDGAPTTTDPNAPPPSAADRGTPPADDGARPPAGGGSGLDPEMADRLRALDLDGERRDLDALAARHAELLRHHPALVTELEALRSDHAEGALLGERLARTDERWRAQTEARRQALRRELDALRHDLETLPSEIDTTDLRRAWTVVHDVLAETLPTLEDVAALREHYGTACARSERLRAEVRERDARRAEHLAQVTAARERLLAALATAPEATGLSEARARVQRALDTLDEQEPDATALETAIDAEAAWQRAIADATDDRSAHRKARLRELGVRLAHVPDLPGLRARIATLRDQTVATDTTVDDQGLETLAHLVEALTADARAAVASRLELVARQAGDPPPEALLRVLQDAARTLDRGSFPDLTEIERAVVATRDTRRATMRRRYLRARQEANRLADAGVAGAAGLRERVAEARAAVDGADGGEAAIARLEGHLADVERQVAERLAGFPARLDAALAIFRDVARLNNDDVAAARRVLVHLDDQREAIGRVSPGLQAQLFRALAEAEATLEHLRTAFEATRAVADQLVAAGRIDDVLGAFDVLFGEEPGTPAAGEEPDRPPPVQEAVDPPAAPGVTAWVADCLAEAQVAGAAVWTADGRLIAGSAPAGADPSDLAATVRTTVEAWRALGRGLGDRQPDLAQLEVDGAAAWVAPLGDDGYALLWGRLGARDDALGARLRHDRFDLARLLREARPRRASGVGDAATEG